MKIKSVAMKDAKAELSSVVDASQRRPIVLTKYGRPYGLVVGVDGRDWDDLALALDEDLRSEIAAARKLPDSAYTSLDDFERELEEGDRRGNAADR
jgi:prevent-host-death family protein